jgi:hypothetical protein
VDADKARGTGAVVRGGSTITPGLPGRIRRVGIASAVAAPIKVAGRLWGAIVAWSGLPYAFPLDTEEGVAGFAEFVADALANADAREQLAASRARIVEPGDAERRRLERNLHDGAQQRLARLAHCLREVEANERGARCRWWVGAPAKATLADRAKHARLGNRQCRVGIGGHPPTVLSTAREN